MHRRMIQWQSLLFSAFMGLTICLSAFAQPSDYPNKPIKVVVTFTPGGS